MRWIVKLLARLGLVKRVGNGGWCTACGHALCFHEGPALSCSGCRRVRDVRSVCDERWKG